MRVKLALTALALLFNLTACMHTATEGSSATDTNAVTQFTRVSMQRTACFGICPVYQVSVTSEGRVAYLGERNVVVTGKHHLADAADMAALSALWDMLAAADFMQLPDYVPGKAPCGSVTTDMPTVIITATRNGDTHQVRYYKGCSNAPQSLDAIAEQIDKAANSARWVENKATH